MNITIMGAKIKKFQSFNLNEEILECLYDLIDSSPEQVEKQIIESKFGLIIVLFSNGEFKYSDLNNALSLIRSQGINGIEYGTFHDESLTTFDDVEYKHSVVFYESKRFIKEANIMLRSVKNIKRTLPNADGFIYGSIGGLDIYNIKSCTTVLKYRNCCSLKFSDEMTSAFREIAYTNTPNGLDLCYFATFSLLRLESLKKISHTLGMPNLHLYYQGAEGGTH